MDLLKNKNSLDEGYLLHWYEIIQVIGRGGFGITYLAHDQNLDRNVAIKEFMPEDFATRESDSTVNPKTGEQKKLYDWGLERFISEARTLAKFNHPNIVRVLSVFEENNTAYMVMEYAQGKDLSVIYKGTPKFTQDQLLDTFIPILDGLSLVHNAGFIHRDIKPANIYICDNESPLLLDFGSARQSLGGKTRALTSLVTYGYAPYEQYNEGTGKQGPWTDIYSLGASMYYGITGKKPMDALVRGGGFLEKGIDSYEPVSVLAKGEYDENFLLAIDKALMFKLEERPANILDWADMLLGKTNAPALPEYMMRFAENDETVVRPWPASGSGTGRSAGLSKNVHSGGQGLIDASGRRNSVYRDSTISENTQQEQQALRESLSRIDYSAQPVSDSKIKKISLVVMLFMAVIGGVFIFGDSLKDVLMMAQSTLVKNSPKDMKKYQQEIQSQNHKKKLQELLIRAQQAFDIGNYVSPKKDNAYDYYKKALHLQADNNAAKRGINNIEKELLNRARAAYIDKQYKQSISYLSQLKRVNPESVNAQSLRKRLSSEQNKIKQISDWLSLADKHIKNNRYTSPANKNAYEIYKKILNREPSNRSARKGIEKIKKHYKAMFKRHIAGARLSSAERDIQVMKKIDIPLDEIMRMQLTLKVQQQKLADRKAVVVKMPATKKLTVAQASKKIAKFKQSIELGYKSRLKQISQFSQGREQFVNRLLSQYKNIDVKISNLKLISATNSARAMIELKNLMDKNNEVVVTDWSRFEIVLSYNDRNELKIIW